MGMQSPQKKTKTKTKQTHKTIRNMFLKLNRLKLSSHYFAFFVFVVMNNK